MRTSTLHLHLLIGKQVPERLCANPLLRMDARTKESKLLNLAERLRGEQKDSHPQLEIVEFLGRQGVLTQCFQNPGLRALLFPQGATSPDYQQARAYALKSSSFALHSSGLLGQVFDELERQGIPALTFKGPVLSQLLYEKLTGRPFGDLDLMVRPEDVFRVQKILLGLSLKRGYPKGFTRSQDQALLRFGKAINFVVPQNHLRIDLHWRLWSQWIAWEVPFEDLWERRQCVAVDGLGNWPTLGLLDQVLFLCLHGAQDGWQKLKTLWDLACFLDRYEVDWSKLKLLSGPRLALVRQGVGLVHHLLACPHPPDLEPFYSDSSSALAYILLSLRRGEPPHHRLLAAQFWSCCLPEAALRSLKALLNPALDDIQAISLPSGMTWLYIAIRMMRLIPKSFQRLRFPSR